MTTVNMLQAKSTLSRLVEAIKRGQELKSSLPAVGVRGQTGSAGYGAAGNRIGVAKGKFEVPNTIDAHNDEVACLF